MNKEQIEKNNIESNTTNGELHAETKHEGPHIPAMQGEKIFGSTVFSNTNLTTFVFLLIVLVFSILGNRALKSKNKSRLKLFLITYVSFGYNYLKESFGSSKDAKKYFGIIAGFFTIILFGNLFGIIIDWLGSSTHTMFLVYFRPMHSDLNTTLSLALIAVISSLMVSSKTHGTGKTIKNYLFNFSGNNFVEKCINVFVGWLHGIGLISTMLSLSLRLFGNIFAGGVLLRVVLFLLSMATQSFFEIGRLASMPFWFFELFVSLVQAIVFMSLVIGYFKSAKEHH